MTAEKIVKQRVVVICPGRGTYNKEELGYLQRLHLSKGKTQNKVENSTKGNAEGNENQSTDIAELVNMIDDYRATKGQVAISELDQMPQYNMRQHTAGENASSLIYACAQADFDIIDRDKYEIVAVTGNSMGWYIALAVAGALPPKAAIELINTMGSMMTKGVIGGQIIYPITDEYWREDSAVIASIEQYLIEVNEIDNCEAYISIHLGGYIVFGGNKAGLKALENILPQVQDRYPMNLFNHAAFHTPLLKGTSEQAKALLSESLFEQPDIPLIDGLGQVWQPFSCDTKALYDYTLDTQVVEPYNFTKAVEVAIKEFAPDKLIILGPGATLGGAVAQSLIKFNWQEMDSKSDFIAKQKENPYVLAMGLAEQRNKVV